MSVHQALLSLSPVETRLLVLFWHLAERWGRVTPAGVVLPLGLTHQILGQLVGCRRASVTTALKEVVESGAAIRRPDGSGLLTGSPPDELSHLTWHNGTAGRHAAAGAAA
jgi:CRP-like cAMP-binding protein